MQLRLAPSYVRTVVPSRHRTVALLALLLASGCASVRTQHLRRESIARVPADVLRGVEGKLDALQPALVRITTWLGQKTGVIIRPEGLILTCAHGSWSPGSREGIRFSDGRTGSAEVLGEAEESDILLLRIREPAGPFPVAPLAADVHQGDWAFIAGLVRGGGSVGLAAGSVFLSDMAGAFGPANRWRNPVLLIDAPAVPGESGAPVLDTRGEIIGIASMAGITDTNVLLVAASVHEIHRILTTLERGESVWSETDAPARLAAYFSALRRNGRALWTGNGEPGPAFAAEFGRCVDRVERRLREEWKSEKELTSAMTAAGLKTLMHEVDRSTSSQPK